MNQKTKKNKATKTNDRENQTGTMRGFSHVDDANAPSTSSSPRQNQNQNQANSRRSFNGGDNVLMLLARREVSPQIKHSPKRLWRGASKCCFGSVRPMCEAVKNPRRGLVSWVEAESLRHFSAKYCPLLPPPRSTIAAAFSPDGKTLASTHGDHTVKIIDWQTGCCLKVLSGHRRTPWVVRFHPLFPEILASGSLDHEVCLWDAKTAECIGSHDFDRPIASIAFHAHGELLAVASGHKLYMWHYNRKGNTSPTVVLKTRRSLRAVHFHPYGAPFLLTAEVNDLEPSDSSLALATSRGYLSYPPPTVYLVDTHSAGRSSWGEEQSLPLPFIIWSSFPRDDGRISLHHGDGDGRSNRAQQRVDRSASVRLLTYSTPSGQYELLLSPVGPSSSSQGQEETGTDSFVSEVENAVPQFAMDTVENMEVTGERSDHLFPSSDSTNLELPLLQGWLIGDGHCPVGSVNGSNHLVERENLTPSTAMLISDGQSRLTGRSSSRHRSSRSRIVTANVSPEGTAFNNSSHNGNDSQPVVSRIQSEIATSLAMAAAAELPCTVKLRIWPHDVKDPCGSLDARRCRLTIPHAVLCSEMGAHFSPCGRFLAICVACVLRHLEADPGLQRQVNHDATGVATSPTRHPISAHQITYELRIYSLEEATFGLVLASRAIRAAHCLTSIQFSPTSEHILLAYGRRHSSLLKSVVIDGETTVPIYTILEVYRVSDMDLVRVLPSAEDEVNVACFHPSVGGGLVYGTKEGRLRILQYEGSYGNTYTTPCFLDENMLEVPTFALEC